MPEVELPRLHVESISAVVSPSRIVLINRSPEPDEADVPLNSTVSLTLMDTSGVGIRAARVVIASALAFDASGFAPGFDGSRSRTRARGGSLRVEVDPAIPFSSLERVSVRVEATTLDGARFTETYTFTAEDRTAPSLVAARAFSSTALTVSFDEPVWAPAPSARFELRPLTTPAVPLEVIGVEGEGGSKLTLQLNAEMSPDARYELRAVGVVDGRGNATAPPHDRVELLGYRPPRPARRRFDIWEMLPGHNRRADHTGELRRFTDCLQDVLDLLLADIDRFPRVFDIERAPPPWLDLILADLGSPFRAPLDARGKRKLASVLVQMYREKGTARGIINATRFFLDVDIVEIRSYAGEGLVLGEAELGVDWILGPSSRFALYAFDVVVATRLTGEQRAHIRALVELIKPAHTHFIDLIEPTPPPNDEDWELGVGRLGVASRLR